MLINCDNCNKEVNKRPSYIKNNSDKGRKNYCSNTCQNLALKTGEYKKCHTCDKEVYKSKSDIKNSKTGFVFCSHSCSAKYSNTTRNSPNLRHGKSIYTKLAYQTYVNQCLVCGFDEKEALQVHHIDENRLNNEIDNLVIVCANHHSLIHRGSLTISQELLNQRKFL